MLVFLANLLETDDKSGLNKKSQLRPASLPADTLTSKASGFEALAAKVNTVRHFFSVFFEKSSTANNPANIEKLRKTIKDALAAVQDVCKALTETRLVFSGGLFKDYSFSLLNCKSAIGPLFCDPTFRRILLIQSKVLLQVIELKIAAFEGLYQGLGKDEQRMLKKTDDILTKAIKELKLHGNRCSLQEVLSKISFNEQKWIEWKNKGCQNLLFKLDHGVAEPALEKRILRRPRA